MKVRLVSHNLWTLPLLAVKVSTGKVREKGIEYYINEYPEEKWDRFREWLIRAAESFPSVLEHAVFTFLIEGVSRVTTHQLVRHRLASYTQESQRYSVYEESYVIPPSIRTTDFEDRFRKHVEDSLKLYREMVDSGIPPEDARYILPQCVDSIILMTVNLRELLHILKLRLSPKAQWEIRELARKMSEEVEREIPFLKDLLDVYNG